MIEAVLFDMDGLMFDTERMWAEAWGLAARGTGLENVQTVLPSMRGRNREGCRQVCLAAWGEDFDFDGFQAKARREMAALVEARGLPKKPGLDALLQELERRGLPAVVATSTRRATTEGYLAQAEVARYFRGVVGGNDVSRGKPDPEVFLKAAALAGADPARCLVLEDSPNGVQAGAAAGCRVVMVPDLTAPDEALRALAAAVVPDLFAVIPLLDTL
ncbi:MAG TPA: HAD family phosphatase [Candidatus Fournierella merdigallinarum]|nr:HAD family phosphatase [Candidatus Fournierella merdigallinarum]